MSTILEERFWSKVDKSGGPDDCWEWIAARSHDGYGQFFIRGSMLHSSHVAWELAYGPVPRRREVCHHCDNPACCNPAHLFLGMHIDNIQDATWKGRMAKKLSRIQANQIRFLHWIGFSQQEIAEVAGVCQTNVSHVVNRHIWK